MKFINWADTVFYDTEAELKVIIIIIIIIIFGDVLFYLGVSHNRKLQCVSSLCCKMRENWLQVEKLYDEPLTFTSLLARFPFLFIFLMGRAIFPAATVLCLRTQVINCEP